ncbi:MAG: outer membrane beta-barrel protein [Bacteroidales bacterium]
MKKNIMMILAMATMAQTADAQWSINPEVGINVSKFNKSTPKIGSKLGAAVIYGFENSSFAIQSGLYHVQRFSSSTTLSAIYEYPESDYKITIPIDPSESLFDIERNGFYNYSGRFIGYKKTARKEKTNYLQLPILARFNYQAAQDASLYVAFGPYLAYALTGKLTYEEEVRTNHSFEYMETYGNPYQKEYQNRKRMDWGILLRGGMEIKEFTLGLEYEISFFHPIPVKKSITPEYQTFSVLFGYKFFTR